MVCLNSVRHQKGLTPCVEVICAVARESESHDHLLQCCGNNGYVELSGQPPCNTDFLELLSEESVLFTLMAIGQPLPYGSNVLHTCHVAKAVARPDGFPCMHRRSTSAREGAAFHLYLPGKRMHAMRQPMWQWRQLQRLLLLPAQSRASHLGPSTSHIGTPLVGGAPV